MRKFSMAILCCISVLTFSCVSVAPIETLNKAVSLKSSDFFPSYPGYSLKYSVSVINGKEGIAGIHWYVFQPAIEDSLFSFVYSTDGMITGVGRYFKQGNDFYFQPMRNISGNQPRFLDLLSLKITMNDNAEYVNYINVKYSVKIVNEKIIALTFDATQSKHQDLRGTGTIILEKNLGIKELTFTHTEAGMFGTAGAKVLFELLNAKKMDLCTYKGKIVDENNKPLTTSAIALGTFWLNPPNIDKPVIHVDDSGNFNFSIFSDKEIPVMFSYGLDKDKKWAYEEKYKIFKVSKDAVWENQNCDLGTIVF